MWMAELRGNVIYYSVGRMYIYFPCVGTTDLVYWHSIYTIERLADRAVSHWIKRSYMVLPLTLAYDEAASASDMLSS
jgi:hypothetical protein